MNQSGEWNLGTLASCHAKKSCWSSACCRYLPVTIAAAVLCCKQILQTTAARSKLGTGKHFDSRIDLLLQLLDYNLKPFLFVGRDGANRMNFLYPTRTKGNLL